jgi:hypothetical protein
MGQQAITYTTARLGFEAQNAAAFRLLRLGAGKAAEGEIIPELLAAEAPQRVREELNA